MNNLGRWRTAVAAGALVLTGCANDPSSGGRTQRGPSSTPASPSAPTTSPAPWAPLPGLGRCGPQPPRLAQVRFRPTVLTGEGRRLPAVTTGRGRTVAVLIHQTDGGGLCGWLDFAARIAEVPGQRALAFDLCGFGDAQCPGGNFAAQRQVDQVRMAIDEAVRSGARRVVLVGASMGGSLAVLTAAADPRVDAVVDLSGPDAWRGASVHRRAAEVTVPMLVAMADDEAPQEVAAARAAARVAVDGSFVDVTAGHGYDLLADADGRPTAMADRVLTAVAGR